MRHPGFGTIGNPPDRDPIRPTSDTRPSTQLESLTDDEREQVLAALDAWAFVIGRGMGWFQVTRGTHSEPNPDAPALIASARRKLEPTRSRLLEERPKVAPESESEKREAFGR